MNYYTAPMEGLTDRIWRQAHQRWFGAPGAPARYYAPFISPPENRVLIKKKMAELDPAANPGAPVIPQLLAKDGALAAWMIGELRKMGYTEVNLNFGCPSGTVTAKGKGAGMLRDLSKLEVFLDEVFSQAEGPISVKTRLGVTSPEEFEAILDLYDRCPICELTIHPRVMRQLYRGEADRAAFANYLPHCRMPVCYNGDITTPTQLKALEAEFPNLSGIMVGRGIIADPALLRQADKLFLPGVGAFADAAAKLRQTGLDRVIQEEAAAGKPLMGICLGMQLLFEESHEFGTWKGLGLIPGKVVPMEGVIPADYKIPHIGWNALHFPGGVRHPLLASVEEGDCVYFVHSYYATDCADAVIATTEYGTELTAAVARGNVMGCQFHPEKSGDVGLAILKTFCEGSW